MKGETESPRPIRIGTLAQELLGRVVCEPEAEKESEPDHAATLPTNIAGESE